LLASQAQASRVKRTSLVRKTPMRRSGRLKRRKGFHRYEGMAEFNLLVWDRDRGRSILTGNPIKAGTPAHHAIPKRRLRQLEATYRFIYDPRIGVTLGPREHQAVETGYLKIRRDQLPACFFEAVEEIAAEDPTIIDYVDRKYPREEN
jgi:hypothetical protein